MEEIFQAALSAVQAGQPACLATIVAAQGSTPRGPGAKMLIRPDGSTLGSVGGGAMENQVILDAQGALQRGQSELKRYSLYAQDAESLGLCGGQADVFLEVLRPQRELVIIGGGHVSLPLAQLGDLLGFRVTVVDDRPEFANAERFPNADLTVVAPPDALTDAVSIGENTCLVIATRAHQHDAQALEAALGTSACYIGMMGSKAKVKAIFDQLLARGVAASSLARVHAPIGLDIGSETPAEIALSIMAEILLALCGGSGRPLSQKGNPLASTEPVHG